MNRQLSQWFGGAAAIVLALAAAQVASAAGSFSNSLTGFTGDSTQPGTQGAVAAAGFSFFSTEGLDEINFAYDHTIGFSSSGATFGLLYGGDGGRNYMRTIDSDYATVSFVAEITVERTGNSQQVFIGMGAGDTALFGVPDWSTMFSSTFVTPEDGSLTTWRSSNDANAWVGDSSPIAAAGIQRVRMDFDSVARTMTYSIDVDYAGGDFAADYTAAPVDLNHIDCPTGCGDPEMPISADFFGPDGWPNEPSRLFFGGDDGVIFRDFSVTATAAPALLGDYNENNTIDAADYTVWRDLLGTAGPLPNDPTPGTIDISDFEYWKANFGNTLGSGAVAAAAVPEPTSMLVALVGLLSLTGVPRRR